MPDPCGCQFCSEHRRVQKIKETGSIEDLRAFIDDLELSRSCIDDELDHKEAILDGSWPNSRITLGHAYRRAIDFEWLRWANGR